MENKVAAKGVIEATAPAKEIELSLGEDFKVPYWNKGESLVTMIFGREPGTTKKQAFMDVKLAPEDYHLKPYPPHTSSARRAWCVTADRNAITFRNISEYPLLVQLSPGKTQLVEPGIETAIRLNNSSSSNTTDLRNIRFYLGPDSPQYLTTGSIGGTNGDTSGAVRTLRIDDKPSS